MSTFPPSPSLSFPPLLLPPKRCFFPWCCSVCSPRCFVWLTSGNNMSPTSASSLTFWSITAMTSASLWKLIPGSGWDSLSAAVMLLFIPTSGGRTHILCLSLLISTTVIDDQNGCSTLSTANCLKRLQATNMGIEIQRQREVTLDCFSNVWLIVQTRAR